MIHFNSEFLGIAHSARTDKLQQGLLRGRLFGGLAILARKSVIKGMYKYSVDSQNRALAVVVQLVSGVNLLIINVYLPCSTNSDEYMTSLLEIYSFIDNCIECCSYDEVIVLGDFNFECDVSVPAYKLLVKVLDEHNLICCEKYANTPIEFTYFQDTLHRYTLIGER